MARRTFSLAARRLGRIARSAPSRSRPEPRRDQACRRISGESQRRAARDVEREMSAHVETGQPDQGHGGQGEGAARRAEPGQGGGAQSDADGGVPGQVSEPGGFPAATAAPRQQRHRPGSAHHPLNQLRRRPGARAAEEEPCGQLTFASPPGGGRARGHGAEGTQLHDDPGGRVQRVGQAVDGPEGPGLRGAHAIAVHGAGRGQQRGEAQAEPSPGIGQRLTKLHRADHSRCRRPGRRAAAG